LKNRELGTGVMGRPVHPGRILKREMAARGLNAHRLSLALAVPANRIAGIANGTRGISAETALRLARYFGNDEGARHEDKEIRRHMGGGEGDQADQDQSEAGRVDPVPDGLARGVSLCLRSTSFHYTKWRFGLS